MMTSAINSFANLPNASAIEICTLDKLCRTKQEETVAAIRALFKPFGWTGSKPSKWGLLADLDWQRHGPIPCTLVASRAGLVLATASLVHRDHDALDCGPWLAGLVVSPTERHTGIASKLIAEIVSTAQRLHTEGSLDFAEGKLYLNTERTINSFDSVDMYARRGWVFNSPEDQHRQTEIVMVRNLSAAL